jgi:hypothetical protein
MIRNQKRTRLELSADEATALQKEYYLVNEISRQLSAIRFTLLDFVRSVWAVASFSLIQVALRRENATSKYWLVLIFATTGLFARLGPGVALYD